MSNNLFAFVIIFIIINIFFACKKEPVFPNNDDAPISNLEEEIILNYFPLKQSNTWEYNTTYYSHWFNDYDGTDFPGGHPIGPVIDTTYNTVQFVINTDTLIGDKTYLKGFSSSLLRKENTQTLLYYYNKITSTHHEFQLMCDSDIVGDIWVSDTLDYTYFDGPANLWFQSQYIEHFDSLVIDRVKYYDVKYLKYYIGINIDDVPSYATLCSDFHYIYLAQDIGPIYWEVDYCVAEAFNTYDRSRSYSLSDYTIH